MRSVLAAMSLLCACAPRAAASWHETVLHVFASEAQGTAPYAGVTLDASGNLYGTTSNGGPSGYGAVYELEGAASGGKKPILVLHAFAGKTDGAFPTAGVILDAAGNIYGTTQDGGPDNSGTVYRLAPPATPGSSWTETILHDFGAGADGAHPTGELAMDRQGNLYGITSTGGQADTGTVFRLEKPATATGAWKETILDSFIEPEGGANPVAGVIFDKSGRLYGTTSEGGLHYAGTVFSLTPPPSNSTAWTKTLLYTFRGGNDGGYARGIIFANDGSIVGTTSEGGATGHGTVFRLAPPAAPNQGWTETLLYAFTGGHDGEAVKAGITTDAEGNLYGTTSGGGPANAGTVFKLSRPLAGEAQWQKTILCDFARQLGANPYAGVTFDNAGNLYGTTFQGLASGDGSIYRLSP